MGSAAEATGRSQAAPADQMLDDTDRAFVRSTGIGVLVGMVCMFFFVAGFSRIVAPDAGVPYWIGLGAFSALVTGGFFGGVVFASRFLIEQEKEEAQAKIAAGAAGNYVRAA